jgi:hypothetical protein
MTAFMCHKCTGDCLIIDTVEEDETSITEWILAASGSTRRHGVNLEAIDKKSQLLLHETKAPL